MSEHLRVDREAKQLRRLMAHLQHMLYEYIPTKNHSEVWDMLYDFFNHEDLVIINKTQFKKYVELEKTVLERAAIDLPLFLKKDDAK